MCITVLVGCNANNPAPEAETTNKLVIYTSMRNVMIDGLIADFKSIYPNVEVEVQIAGAGTLMKQIESENENGDILADIIWTSEVPDFYYMKNQGWLLKYRPAGADNVFNPQENTDDYFIPARLCTMGIMYNTNIVSVGPLEWNDLFGADFEDGFAIADPTNSGTSFMSVAKLNEIFGEQFFYDLRANGAIIGQGSSQVVDDVASGTLAACLAVDYMAFDLIDSGASVAMAYPQELIAIPSPVAIFKDSANMDNAKNFVDYLISLRAQQIIANSGTLPVLKEVTIPEKYNIPPLEEAMKRAIKVKDDEMIQRKDELVGSFLDIMKGDY
jgi:iron(III) transport system substrate-binding protein